MRRNFYTNKYRAQFFYNIGMAMLSLLGIASTRILLFNESFRNLLNWKGLLIAIISFTGLYLIFKALDVYEEIDKNEGDARND